MRWTALTAGACCALAVAASGAGAVDDIKPTACNGLAFKDPAADQTNLQVPAGDMTPSTELTGGFFKYDAAKGAEAATYNLTVKELSREVPTGYTTMSWNAYYTTSDGTIRFVRTLVDFDGGETYEYGTFTPNPAEEGVTGVSTVQGNTAGKLFEGPDGVVQMVIPAEFAPSGAKFANVYANSGQGRTLPGSVPAPNRGLTPVLDIAPDDGADAGATGTVLPCEGIEPGPTPDPGTGNTPPPSSGNTTLPVTVTTKAVRAKKARKRLKLKLRSSERVTSIGAQLRKGTKVRGTGKLAALDGSGTLKLKLRRKLEKGKYVLDLAGNDAAGKRLLTSATIKVK